MRTADEDEVEVEKNSKELDRSVLELAKSLADAADEFGGNLTEVS